MFILELGMAIVESLIAVLVAVGALIGTVATAVAVIGAKMKKQGILK